MESLKTKKKVIESIEGELSPPERDEARGDPHAKRPPRPCGITVHTGVGCPLVCAYCYIYDMGFPGVIKPYRLSPLQLAYALAHNPHVAVGEWGTLVAVGSITEPFLPETRELAVEYIKTISNKLGNPVQVSTKIGPPQELSELEKKPDVLVSVADISGRLEPKAPSPLRRLETGAEYMKRGGNATLFIRPIVPGVTDRELGLLLKTARDLGYRRVVLGTLRATINIAKRLKAFGVDVFPYVERLGNRQTPIKYPKTRLIALAKDMGLEVLPASCASNVIAHGQACALCGWGPCGDITRLKIDTRDVEEFLEARGYRGIDVEVKGFSLRIKNKLSRIDKIFLEQALRIKLETPG